AVRLPPILALLAALLAAVAPRAAIANMARGVIDGERYAVLAPSDRTSVRVDREALDFAIAPELRQAAVVATYTMTNAGAAVESDDIAFVYVREDRDADPIPSAVVEVDGAPIPVRHESDGEVLAPALRAWLAAHPEVERALRAVADRGESVG